MFGKAMIENSGTVKIFLLSTIVILLVSSNPINAQVPNTISYQGLLADGDGDEVDDGDYNLHFRIWDDITDGTMLWEENHIGVEVREGRFHVILTGLANVEFDEPYWVGISVQGGAELPRFELTSTGYSLNARSIVDDAITSAKIQDGTIQFADIGQNGSSTNQIMKWNGSTWIAAQDETGDAGVTDHGDLTGLEDDDHPQYLHTAIDDTISSNILFGDSAMVTGSSNRVIMGTASGCPETSILCIERELSASTDIRYGIDIDLVDWDGTGDVRGIYSQSESYYGATTAIYGKGIGNNIGSTIGVMGRADGGTNAYGVVGHASNASNNNYAGEFYNDVMVYGNVFKTGGTFIIDHPLDPENKYLQHSFVESPDMMNIYNGNVSLDGNGNATIDLPEWFEALNIEFRYQLTAIGAPGPNLYIAREISGNSFEISGGEPGMKVSWQVTGIRHDKWAQANRIQVEIEKKNHERGLYRHPELYGSGVEKHIEHELLIEMRGEIRGE